MKFKNLHQNRNFTIKGADKDGKIVIMDAAGYIELLLNDKDFYEKLDV